MDPNRRWNNPTSRVVEVGGRWMESWGEPRGGSVWADWAWGP